jgi:hypothetical protein
VRMHEITLLLQTGVRVRKGMLTPERLNILQKAFDRAKRCGLHDHVRPPPISFASELVGLIARKDISASNI